MGLGCHGYKAKSRYKYRLIVCRLSSNSYISPCGVVVLHIGVGRSPTPMYPREGYNLYNLVPRQHHCTREIWVTFLDVAWVTDYITSFRTG